VIPPDETDAATKEEWTFTVHSRRKSYQLSTKTQADANRWINAIQDIIDSSPLIETPTDKLIDELKLVGPDEVAAIYAQHKVGRC
jgi:myosin X